MITPCQFLVRINATMGIYTSSIIVGLCGGPQGRGEGGGAMMPSKPPDADGIIRPSGRLQ